MSDNLQARIADMITEYLDEHHPYDDSTVGGINTADLASVVIEGLDLRQLIATLRERDPLRNDPWVKGYHAALFDLENLAGLA